jgi:glutathione S-transferase
LPPLLGTNPEEKGLIADRIWRVDLDGFYAIAEAIRNELPGFKDRALTGPINYDQIPELARRGAARIAHFLETFEAHLLGENDYVAGASFSAADIMAFVTIEFAGWIKLELPSSAERAHDWYTRIKARPSAAL